MLTGVLGSAARTPAVCRRTACRRVSRARHGRVAQESLSHLGMRNALHLARRTASDSVEPLVGMAGFEPAASSSRTRGSLGEQGHSWFEASVQAVECAQTGNHLVAQSGASTRELMQRMGHSTMRAALIYQHATEARSRDLADRLNALVTGQLQASEDGGWTDA